MRRILKIPHSFYSRVSNHDVGVISNTIPLSLQLLKHQLMLYGRISRLPSDHILRVQCLNADSPTPIRVLKRGRGRPRCQWADCVFNHVMHASNNMRTFEQICDSNPMYWKYRVQRYIDTIGAAMID